MLCLLKSCQRCKGDLVLDGDEWRCWQCARCYYPAPLPAETRAEPAVSDFPHTTAERTERQMRPRGGYSRRAMGDVNSRIAARDRGDQRWQTRNEESIRYLDEGQSVPEISSLVGRDDRQVRVVRELRTGLRAAKGAESISA